MVGAYLNDEVGVHIIESNEHQETHRNLVHDISSIEDYEPPKSIGRKDRFLQELKCRTWKYGVNEIIHHPTTTHTGKWLNEHALLALELTNPMKSRIKAMFS